MKDIYIELLQEERTTVTISPDLLVVYGLCGTTEVIAGQKQFILQAGGVLAINPMEEYIISCSEKSMVLVLHITQEIIRVTEAQEQKNLSLYVNDDSSGKHEEYDEVRFYFASIFQNCLNNTQQSNAQLAARTYELLEYLYDNFVIAEQTPAKPDNEKSQQTIERKKRILTYIYEHWREPISLAMIAKQEYLSHGYLMQFFKESFGVTFTQYLTEIRLQHAVNDLERGELSVTDVAFRNGFKNTNAFISAVKAKYGMTPNEYRRHFRCRKTTDVELLAGPQNEADGIAKLLQYLELKEKKSYEPKYMKRQVIQVNAKKSIGSVVHSWKKLMNIGYAQDGLLAEIQRQVCEAQKQIGFSYIGFHGILNDDMGLYREDEKGNPFLEFSMVDILLDFVLDAGLRPYLELSYLPSLLAKEKSTVFDCKNYMSMYNNEDKYRFLICGLLQHCIERYGRAEVQQWRFAFPSIPLHVFFHYKTMEEACEMYYVTWQCVKSVDKQLLFAGPDGDADDIQFGTLFAQFLQYATEHNCMPDIITMQCFPYRSLMNDSEVTHFFFHRISYMPAILSEDEQYMRHGMLFKH